MLDKIIGFIAKIWLSYIKPYWSRFHWRKYLGGESAAVPTVKATRTDIGKFLSECYSHFDWTMDGIDELTDSFCPLPYLYNKYVSQKEAGKKLQDDCDGFHSVVWHVLNANNIECALITVVVKPFWDSHTMCLYRGEKDGKKVYFVANYSIIYKAFNTIEEFIAYYENLKKTKIRYWQLDKYDYEKQMFVRDKVLWIRQSLSH